MKKESFKSQKH